MACPTKTTRALFRILGILVVLHLSVTLCDIVFWNSTTERLIFTFHLDVEKNLPSSFATLLWILNSALFYATWRISKNTKAKQFIWLLLTPLFLFLAIDEWASIHEKLTPFFRATFNASGFFHFAWVIPYGITVTGLSVVILPTLRQIESTIRRWFILSAITFSSASIGLEMLQASLLEFSNERGYAYFYLMTIEETLEMAGLILLSHALLLQIKSYQSSPPRY